MTALDDFIAQDPARDFVDLRSSVRWTELDVRNRTELILEGAYPVSTQRILARKADVYQLSRLLTLLPDPELPLPVYSLSLEEKQEILAFGQFSILCGALKDVMWARAQRLTGALDYEDTRTALSTLPPPLEGEPDPFVDARIALQAILDAATPETVALVAERDAWRAG